MVSVRIQAEPSLPGDHGWFPTLGDRAIFVPVAWFNQQALATQDGTSQFSDMYLALKMQVVLRYAGLGCGIVSVMWIIATAYRWLQKSKQGRETGSLLEGATP